MPFVTEWEDPEIAMRHNCVVVYHAYKNDDLGQGTLDYWFTTNVYGSADGPDCFDIRDLAAWKTIPPDLIKAGWAGKGLNPAIKAALVAAIDSGELTQKGVAK